MRTKLLRKNLTLTLIGGSITLTACSLISPPSPTAMINLPPSWQYEGEGINSASLEQAIPHLTWVTFLDDSDLTELIKQSIQGNHDLQLQQLNVEIALSSMQQSQHNIYWPSLSMGLSGSKSSTSATDTVTTNVGLNANLEYEINLWGQLSDAKKAATFNYAATKATFEYNKLNTIKNTATAWFNYIAAQQQVKLYQQRLVNLANNLSIVESQYRSGLSTALNVYLARNDLEQEQATLLSKQQELADNARTLRLQVGDYPMATNFLEKTDAVLPIINYALPEALPSTLLAKKPELQAAWLAVLEQNAEVAIAHKARFPQLTLTASANQRSDEFNNLLNSTPTLWSIGSSLVQPILNGGSLKAAEKIARLNLQKLEITYEQQVYKSFSDVHSLLEQQSSLFAQQQHTQQASTNAKQADELALDQYQKGLITYTTVLEAQRRAFNAELQLINLQQSLAINTVELLANFAIEPEL